MIFILYYIMLYYIIILSEWGGDPRPISSLGALDGGRTATDSCLSVCLSVVCLSSV